MCSQYTWLVASSIFSVLGDDWCSAIFGFLGRVVVGASLRWTIYEQYVACALHIDVTFVMPYDASVSLSQKLSLGDAGIAEVTGSLCEVNVAHAEAFGPRDEKKVKETIQRSVGFDRVNSHVKSAMVQWISGVVRDKFHQLVNEASEETFYV